MGRADLHLHSTASDGRFSPREVVRRAHGAGLEAIALTDHDTISGLAAAGREARRLGIGFVPGCEISVEHQGIDVHLLAYFVDPESPRLRSLLEGLHQTRRERIGRMVERLVGLGLPLRPADVWAEAGRASSVGRLHVARALVTRGLVRSVGQVFRDYLGDGGPAYVPKATPSSEEILSLVWSTGGVPVVAHPGLYHVEDPEAFFASWELGGIEVGHPSHTPEMRLLLERWARDRNLAITGGSDWHGQEEEDAYIGCEWVSSDVIADLRRRRPPAGLAETLPDRLDGVP